MQACLPTYLPAYLPTYMRTYIQTCIRMYICKPHVCGGGVVIYSRATLESPMPETHFVFLFCTICEMLDVQS